MSANEDKDAWKSDYISLLDKPRFEDAQMPEALVLKLKNAPPFFYRDRKFNNFAEGLASKGRILTLSERCPISSSIGFTFTNGYKPTSGRKMFKRE
jgi:hypothetical protein